MMGLTEPSTENALRPPALRSDGHRHRAGYTHNDSFAGMATVISGQAPAVPVTAIAVSNYAMMLCAHPSEPQVA